MTMLFTEQIDFHQPRLFGTQHKKYLQEQYDMLMMIRNSTDNANSIDLNPCGIENDNY